MIIRFRLGEVASLAMMIGALVMASCSTNPASPPTSRTAATTTKPYGSLTLATNFGNHLDPLRDSAVGYGTIGAAVIDSLVYRDVDKYELTTGIAERWEIAPDGLTHTFYIRKGVKFHDGSDLTGADVKFSIERLMSAASIESDAPIWRSAVASVQLNDDYTVALRLKSPQFELLKNSWGAMTAVMPKKYIEEKGDDYFARHPMGSGPWKVLQYEHGVRLELEAVESHWRAVPKFKNLTVLSVPQEATKVAMLKTGELDMAAVSTDSVSGIEAAGLRIKSYPSGGGYQGFLLYDVENPQKYAFGDVRVRKALQLAINAKEMADNLFRGRAEPVAVSLGLVDSDSKANAYDPNLLKPDPYDPEGAKKLLTEAGYPNGFNTRLYDVGSGDMRSTMSLAVAGYWRKIGIIGEMVAMDYGAFFPKFQARSPETWNSFYTIAHPGAKTWAALISRYTMKGNAKNTNNPRIAWLVDNIPSTRDPVERERFALEAAVLAKNEYSVISLLGTHTIVALGKKVGDVAPGAYVLEISGLMYETITHAK